MSGNAKIAISAVAALLCASCAASGPIEDIQPGEKPALESDEAGLWMQMDQAEEALRTSGKVDEDPALNAYVQGIVCKLSPEHCPNIRIYIVRSANFNASMAPNGAMHVWTGLILRAQNEAQLAYVLGHELAHYERRHTLKWWRDLRAKMDGLVFFQLATALTGLGLVGDLAALAVIDSNFGFSRDQESEADILGFEKLAAAGYDPREASKIWQLLIEERDAAEEPKKSIFFSSHPPSEDRRDALATLAEGYLGTKDIGGDQTFDAVTSGFRIHWLRDELRERKFAQTEVLVQQQMAVGRDPGELHFVKGELHRLRGEEEDDAKAAAAYETALLMGTMPPETHRSLGLIYWDLERHAEARRAFQDYLIALPEAGDRAMIESYIQQIQ